jgi:hypothetical protein
VTLRTGDSVTLQVELEPVIGDRSVLGRGAVNRSEHCDIALLEQLARLDIAISSVSGVSRSRDAFPRQAEIVGLALASVLDRAPGHTGVERELHRLRDPAGSSANQFSKSP